MIHWSEDRKLVEKEFARMGFSDDSRWRISDINRDFELCNTYPRFLILPSCFKDEDLESVAKFRYFRRIPTAVWRHLKNGCFIVRSSQPTVGWFGWFRNEMDENLVLSYVRNTMPPPCERANTIDIVNGDDDETDSIRLDESVDNDDDLCDRATLVDEEDIEKTPQHARFHPPSHQQRSLSGHKVRQNNHNNSSHSAKSLPIGDEKAANANENTPETPSSVQSTPTSDSIVNGHGIPPTNDITAVNDNNAPVTPTTSKMLIIDARSYTAAMANRAKGGGCECSEYYPGCEVQFMNLANIHSIRKSYHAIRSVCEAYSEQSNNWVSFLDNSRWLHHISGLLKSALLVVDTIDVEERSIQIHCSDGWDRTPQLVALAEIMLDSHYRTFDGFRTLVQREWLDFGHKFADRCGSNPCNEDPNERCPAFLQWLDCVQQLQVQYPKHFEFNSFYLDKLNRHTYSNIFGTFSYNSTQERFLSRVDDRAFSLWSYFDSSRRRFMNENYVESDEILRPSFKVRDLHFWKEVYLPPLRNQTPYMPIASNIDNKKFYDSLYIDGLTRTVCK